MENNLKRYRLQKMMYQADLARKAGVSRQTIVELEKSDRIPSLKTANKIALVLGKSVEDIFYPKCNARSTKHKEVTE